MTQTTGALQRGSADVPVVAAVSAAHFVSHYYMLILPPLFDVIRADFGVTYTELGLALTAFNVITTLGQTPAGFLVDRLGPRILLIGGLLLGAASFAFAGLTGSYWVFVLMFGLAGLANAIYHPANYAMLSHHVAPNFISRAFSIHTFAGMLGSTAAPVGLLLMQSQWGWRGAYIGSALLGVVVAAVLIALREPPQRVPAKPKSDDTAPAGWNLLLSTPILVNLVFFVLFALASAGLQNYSVVALGALYGVTPATANTALTAHLLLSAIGVLVGGPLAGRTSRHNLVAGLGFLAVALFAALLAVGSLGSAMIIGAMALAGFFIGLTMPSRDMIVRAVTPPGSFGKVFGFVTTGFSLGGIVAPLLFGLAMDHGAPRWVFLLTALFCLGTVASTIPTGRKPG